MGKETKEGLGEAMRRIREILSWFDEREEVDVEEGLKKVKEGAELIARSKERLMELENEFAEVKAKLDLNDE